ncbi:MAG: hypothetical protein OEZ39_19700 [Gammaproteobacteria bacterium]|nr:hypothetical protein [Gammaproteobacteria bacterium]MDH5654092.1 hypothetical protein [Gammaproteobacteria bacterium]
MDNKFTALCLRYLMILILMTFVTNSAVAARVDYSCVVLDISIMADRAHVLCAEPPIKSRGGYPKDTGHQIMFFALPLSETENTGRFIQMANTAIITGYTMLFSFTSGDYSGETYGCNRVNCRKPWMFALESRPSTP